MNHPRPKARLSHALGIPLTRKVDRPSYRLRPGQVVAVRERSRRSTPFQLATAGANAGDGTARPCLSVELAELREPARHEVPVHCDEQFVVEFHSR